MLKTGQKWKEWATGKIVEIVDVPGDNALVMEAGKRKPFSVHRRAFEGGRPKYILVEEA